MKLIAIFFSGLMTMNCFSAPIITEAHPNVLKDDRDSQLVFYFPDKGNLVIENEIPQFGLSFWNDLDHTGGEMIGIWNLSKSDELKLKMESFSKQGMRVAPFPVMISRIGLSTYNIGGYFYGFNFPMGPIQVDTPFEIKATISWYNAGKFKEAVEEGKITSTFAYCTDMKGVTPFMNGTIVMETKKVFEYFKNKKPKTPKTIKSFNREDIFSEFKELMNQNLIKITINGGDGIVDDYLVFAMNAFISKNYFFIHPQGEFRARRLYEFDSAWNVPVAPDTITLKGRREIEREYCTDLSFEEVKNYPELIVVVN